MRDIQQTPQFEPKVVECRDCQDTFWLTADELQFYFERGLSQPVRCPACRKRRREANGQAVRP